MTTMYDHYHHWINHMQILDLDKPYIIERTYTNGVTQDVHTTPENMTFTLKGLSEVEMIDRIKIILLRSDIYNVKYSENYSRWFSSTSSLTYDLSISVRGTNEEHISLQPGYIQISGKNYLQSFLMNPLIVGTKPSDVLDVETYKMLFNGLINFAEDFTNKTITELTHGWLSRI